MINKYIGVGLLAALLGTCCVTSDIIYNGIAQAKSIWFLLVCGFAAIYLAGAHIKKPEIIRLNYLDLTVSAFLLFLIIHPVLQHSTVLSRKNLENTGLLLSYFFTRKIVSDDRFSYQTFSALILMLTFSQLAIAAMQWLEYTPSYNSNFRFSGFFFNPSPFLIFLSSVVVYCLTSFLYEKNKVIKALGISLFTLSLPIVVIGLSRSAWLGLAVGILLVLAIRFQPVQRTISYFNGRSLKVIIIALLVLLAFYTANYLYHVKKDSADGRLLVWRLSLKIIQDHPFGIGQENFPAWFLKYQSAYFQLHPERMAREGRLADTVHYAFNDLLHIIVEQGLVGGILFLLLLLTAWRLARTLINSTSFDTLSIKQGLMTGAVASVSVIVVSGLFSYPLVILPIKILFFISLAIISARYDAAPLAKTPSSLAITKIQAATLSALRIALGTCFLICSTILYHAYFLETKIASEGYRNPSIKSLQRYAFLVETEPWYALRTCDYLLHNGNYDKAVIQMEKSKAITSNKSLYFALGDMYTYQGKQDKAEVQYRFLYYALPSMLTPKYMLAKFYYTTRQENKWQIAAKEVLSFQPKIASPVASEMISEIRELNSKLSNLNK